MSHHYKKVTTVEEWRDDVPPEDMPTELGDVEDLNAEEQLDRDLGEADDDDLDDEDDLDEDE